MTMGMRRVAAWWTVASGITALGQVMLGLAGLV